MKITSNQNDNQLVKRNPAAQERADAEKTQKASDQKKNRSTVFAGDLKINNDMVTQRKQGARKKALQIIGSAFKSDRKAAQNIRDMRDKVAQLQSDIDDNMDIIGMLDQRKEELRQEYGVAEDSAEQQDLELLEKEVDSQKHLSNVKKVTLTDEEQERLAVLHEQPLTEYQQRSLDVHNQEAHFEREIDDLQTQVIGYNRSIVAARQEQLKKHTMVDAQKDADAVMAQAGREIRGLLVDEAKDSMDKELEKQVEAAKQKAKEQEKKNDRTEEKQKQPDMGSLLSPSEAKRGEQASRAKEQEKQAEEQARRQPFAVNNLLLSDEDGMVAVLEGQEEIKTMLREMKLLDEDLKGSAVDEDI